MLYVPAMIARGPDVGLRWVPTPALEKLLRMVHRQEIRLPMGPVDVAAAGLQAQSERILGVLRGLDAAAVRAVLIATLAERKGDEQD